MAFGIVTNTQKEDVGFIKGRQREVACQCWFSTKGRVIPLMLKIEDEDGEIRTIRQIQVLSQEEKRYAGARSLEFNCIITIMEQQIDVQLIYYKEDNRWVLVYR